MKLTVYWMRVRYAATGHTYTYPYLHMSTRAMEGLLMEPYAEVVAEWQTAETPARARQLVAERGRRDDAPAA